MSGPESGMTGPDRGLNDWTPAAEVTRKREVFFPSSNPRNVAGSGLPKNGKETGRVGQTPPHAHGHWWPHAPAILHRRSRRASRREDGLFVPIRSRLRLSTGYLKYS